MDNSLPTRARGADQTRGLDYLDTTKESWGPEWFADENHVNGSGSARLTDLVAGAVDRLAG